MRGSTPQAPLGNVYLQPKQEQLFNLIRATGPDAATVLGYGGAASGGKSFGLRKIAYALALTEKCTIFIIRRNYRELYENHIIRFLGEHPESNQYYTDKRGYEFVEHTGSRIVFRYADTLEEIKAMSRGPEARYIFVDQAEQFSGEELFWLSRPNRDPLADENQCKFVLFFNPGGLGTEYLRRIFFLKQYQEQELPATRFAFIQAYGWDNHEWFKRECPELVNSNDFYALPDDERKQIFITRTSEGRRLNSFPPHIRIGELEGSFTQFSGQYFAGVWDENKCVLPISKVEQIIQPWWRRWLAQDWGFADHAATGWFATGKLSPDDCYRYFGMTSDWPIDVIIVYREHVVNETAERDLAMEIVEKTPQIERKNIKAFYLSNDAFSKEGSAHPASEQMDSVFVRHGLPRAERAVQDRIAGWRTLYNGFRQTSALTGSTVNQERAKQGPLILVSSACPDLISAIPLAVRDPQKPEDVVRAPTLWEDLTDMLRYGAHSFLCPRNTPVEVRYAEEVLVIPDYSQRHMASLQFKEKERKNQTIRRPGWR